MIIDRAPGKELIPLIIESRSFDDFYQFYKARVDWAGRPLIHDRMVSYGIFDDLVEKLENDKETVKVLIDFSIQIAKDENDKRFINSIFLLLDLCTVGLLLHLPAKEQVNLICGLQKRVQRLSFLPNLAHYWNSILDYCNNDDLQFKRDKFLVSTDDYRFALDIRFSDTNEDHPKPCPLSESELMLELNGIAGVYKKLRFVQAVMIEKMSYWVWVYENISGNVWDWHILVRQDENGNTMVFRDSFHKENKTDIIRTLCNYHLE